MSKLSFQTFCIEFYSHHIGMSSNEVFICRTQGRCLPTTKRDSIDNPRYIFSGYI